MTTIRISTPIAILALVIGIVCTTPAYADTNYGTYGAWNISRSAAPNGMPLCDMMQVDDGTHSASTAFVVMASLPTTVHILLIWPLKGLRGMGVGQRFQVYSTLNNDEKSVTTYTVIDDGFMASGTATTAQLHSFATDIMRGKVWLWKIAAPEAGISLRVPFEGFVSAVNALGRCGTDIGAPF